MSFRWIFLEDQIIYDIVRLPTVCVAEASVSSFNIFRSGCLRTYLQADGGVVK